MFRSLTARLIAWSLALTGTVYVATIGLSNRSGRRAAIAAAEREAHNETEAAARAVEDVLHAVEEGAAALGRAVSEHRTSPDALDRLVRRFSDDNRQTVARYSLILAGDAGETAPQWYRDTRERGTSGWGEPYKDPELQNAVVITWSSPLRGSDGRFGGAVAASLRLDFLSTVVREACIRKGCGRSAFAASAPQSDDITILTVKLM